MLKPCKNYLKHYDQSFRLLFCTVYTFMYTEDIVFCYAHILQIRQIFAQLVFIVKWPVQGGCVPIYHLALGSARINCRSTVSVSLCKIVQLLITLTNIRLTI